MSEENRHKLRECKKKITIVCLKKTWELKEYMKEYKKTRKERWTLLCKYLVCAFLYDQLYLVVENTVTRDIKKITFGSKIPKDLLFSLLFKNYFFLSMIRERWSSNSWNVLAMKQNKGFHFSKIVKIK